MRIPRTIADTLRGRVWCGLLCLMASLLPANAVVPNQNVQSLYDLCKEGPTSPKYSYCVGYISGVAEMLSFLHQHKQLYPEYNNLFEICDTPSYGAMAYAYVNWAEKNPKEWGKDRIIGVLAVLVANWPCHPN
jgi:hypothetical protein